MPDKQKRYVTMRFRILFPAAVLFLAFGVAFTFAVEPADEKDHRETIYPFRYPASTESNNIFSQYFFDNAGNNTLTIRLFPYKSITDPENAWRYYTAGQFFDYSTNNTPDEGASLSDARIPQSDTGSIPATASTTAPTANGIADENTLPVYDFSIPFDERITEEIGFTEPSDNDDEYELSFLKDEFMEPKDSQLSNNGLFSSLVFQKKAFPNSPNNAHILFGGAYDKKFREKDDSAGISFSTPLALFFFMLGLGIVLVIFTSIGKNED